MSEPNNRRQPAAGLLLGVAGTIDGERSAILRFSWFNPVSSGGHALNRIAPLDQRTALPDQCLHLAEADVRLQGGSQSFTQPDIGAIDFDWIVGATSWPI